VVASAISRGHHDEALRELLLQLSIATVATLAAASLVGYRTARAALNPVESYRVAAEDAGAKGEKRLPVSGRDDELTRLGRTFNALLDRLEASSTRERQFLADASHELRAPLALMKAELEWVLVRPRDAAETRTTLESLRDQVDRMVDLSNALLDLEELRSVKPRRGDRVGLVALASDSAARFQRQAAGQGRQIRQVGAGPAVVAGDRRWLELAIDNLVSNALRYGTGEVRVATAAGPTTVTISVEDDGAGFPPEFVDVAFDRFTRADDARSTRGTGLGLAVVSAVADFHQGTATIAGSRVTLTLPRAN
jgi:signal transduction histidine kinase